MRVILVEDATTLQEVEIVAYGVQKNGDDDRVLLLV